jgi:hypothetical protein
MDVERICLLDICPSDAGQMQRRVVEVVIDGRSEWREFDVVRTFADKKEALAYAAQHGIDDMDV